MNRRIIEVYQQDKFLGSHRLLLFYAHIIAFIHGIAFISQGTLMFDGLIKHALTNQDAWHGGLPALSIFNMSLIIGISTIFFIIVALFFIIGHVRSVWHPLLTCIIFLCGGGFIFFFISIIVHISLNIKIKNHSAKSTILGETLLGVLFIWLWASWFFGWMIPDLMQDISIITFITFDIIIPTIIVLSLRTVNLNPKHVNP